MSKELEVLLELADGAMAPHYASEEAAGADLRAHLTQPLQIAPGAVALVPTGVKIALPKGYEAQVRPRSGLALKEGLTVLNTPGTIDSDYRGEIGIILINHGAKPFVVQPGMRLAQLVVAPVVRARFVDVQCLSVTVRGSGGFGHTGCC